MIIKVKAIVLKPWENSVKLMEILGAFEGNAIAKSILKTIILYKMGVYSKKKNKICIPKTSLREKLIREQHVGSLTAHIGRDMIIIALQGKDYWPKLKSDVAKFILHFPICQNAKGTSTNIGLYIPFSYP